MRSALYDRLLKPNSRTQDSRRREFILNVLLTGVTSIALLAFVASATNRLAHGSLGDRSAFTSTVSFLVIMLVLWFISRRGGHRFVSYFLVSFLALVSVSLMISWTFELPAAELLYALVIVMAGVLLNTRAALVYTLIGSLAVLLLGYAQAYGHMHPKTDWFYRQIDFSDAIAYVALLLIIGTVSWLSNREIDRSLARARRSEAALARERDSLERKVVERTRELEEAQLSRWMEVQRFIEFGRLSANLLHEVANPLAAASINLEQLDSDQPSQLVLQARKNLQHLERYLEAARKQLQSEGRPQTFGVKPEIRQVMAMLAPLARKANVELVLGGTVPAVKLYGDPIKFSQLLANVVINAIDAYDGYTTSHKRRVSLVVDRDGAEMVVRVTDNGKGIGADELPHLFEPFYSTKASAGRGLGIGLAMVKQFVEDGFGGSVTVASEETQGTEFTIRLPLRDRA